MNSFKTFEDIEAWQKARELNKQIYKISNLGSFKKDFSLKDQIRRASVSIISNIAEGFERDGRKEFIQFLSIAKGSAGEVRSLLFVAIDNDYIEKEEFKTLYANANEIGKMIGGLINYLRSSYIKGSKF
ncbi:MAG: four helix bundle protein [Ignavibacteriales bacterium]|nr:four helix bundle protein [Ignavibacteriales bacterium]